MYHVGTSMPRRYFYVCIICFWDLYEAMGGKNSMVAWVNKGLAQKDYTHFSFKGAKYVGEMFYEAIIQEIE